MRMVVSAPTEHPLVWGLTKIENTHPFGIQKITIYQTQWNDKKDFIEKDEYGNISCMWADYYEYSVAPKENHKNSSPSVLPEHSATISTSTPFIKVGGGYKTFTFKSSNDSLGYENCTFEWGCNICNNSVDNIVTKIDGKKPNQKKIKIPNDSSMLGKTLNVKCTMTNNDGSSEIGEIQLEITE